MWVKRSILALVLGSVTACIPKYPSLTTRPEVSIAPWVEKTVRSPASDTEYRYFHLDGPAPGAPVMLLLPGGLYDARIFLNMKNLRERFELYAVDWPENSSFFTGHVTDYGEMAADFLGAIGVKELYLGGVSMGTFASIDLASRKKEFTIKGLFLFSTVMLGINEKEIKRRRFMVGKVLRLGSGRIRAYIEYSVLRAKYDTAPGTITLLDIFWVRPYSYYYELFSIAKNQGRTPQDTRAITCPTLVLQGSKDKMMSVKLARLTPSVFHDAEYVEIPGGKHSMVFSKGPEFVRTIFDFLDRRAME